MSPLLVRTRAAARRWVSLTAAAALLGGTLVTLGGSTPTAQAADDTNSAVTVKWAGGNDPAIQQYQPDHAALSDGRGKDAGSGHWSDFKDLGVSVSQTKGLKDGAVRVTATGMAPVKDAVIDGQVILRMPSNFLQLMQCWGPDPNAADFIETCQFGAHDVENGPSAYAPAAKVLGESTLFGRPRTPNYDFIPFRTSSGERSAPIEVKNESGAVIRELTGTSVFFDTTTTNEQIFVPINSNRTATTSFEVQSAAAAPHMGCGAATPAGAGKRCWLVVVPRGIHSGTAEGAPLGSCSSSNNMLVREYGSELFGQAGGPLDPRCTLWQNRMVIPLDFEDVVSQCPAGSSERRVIGSELFATALGSWQSTLCNRDGGAAYGLTTNSGNLVRRQLLTGQADFAAVVDPATPTSIGEADPALLEEAELSYAPLANTALVVGVNLIDEGGATEYRDVKLTPRLLAKVLTQSYLVQLPRGGGKEPDHYADRPIGILDDPEWLAVGNPKQSGGGWGLGARFAFLRFGPGSDDTVRAVWKYVQADDEAVAFLQGESDPWGMTVNPYYLPAGHPGALGGGYPSDLSTEQVDTFPLADQTVRTHMGSGVAGELDSVTLLPYATSLLSAGQGIARALDNVYEEFDPFLNLGKGGFYGGTQTRALGQFAFGITDAATARQYGLTAASLRLPNSATFVAPTDDTIAAAVGSMRTADDGTSAIDYSTIGDAEYPLTTTVSAVIDLASAKLTPEARAEYSYLLRYAAKDGNVRGEGRGQLPDGYVPLTSEQATRTLALADRLLDTAGAPTDGHNDPSGGTTATPGSGAAGAATTAGDLGASATQTRITAVDTATPSQTPATGAQGVLGGALLAGLAGGIAAPFLLRRRQLS